MFVISLGCLYLVHLALRLVAPEASPAKAKEAL
jgi:hypothetical protein